MKADVFDISALVKAYAMFINYVVDRVSSESGSTFKTVMTSTKESISMYRTLMYYKGGLVQFFEPYKIVAVGPATCENKCCKGVAIVDQNKLILVIIQDPDDDYKLERTLH